MDSNRIVEGLIQLHNNSDEAWANWAAPKKVLPTEKLPPVEKAVLREDDSEYIANLVEARYALHLTMMGVEKTHQAILKAGNSVYKLRKELIKATTMTKEVPLTAKVKEVVERKARHSKKAQ